MTWPIDVLILGLMWAFVAVLLISKIPDPPEKEKREPEPIRRY